MPNVSIPIAVQKKEYILQQLSNGKLVRQIAEELGCHRMSISHTLANDPEYQQAINEALEARLDRAEEALETAADGLSLARAREQNVAARWRCERLNPGRWAPVKQAVQVNAGDGQVQVNIVSYSDSNEAT